MSGSRVVFFDWVAWYNKAIGVRLHKLASGHVVPPPKRRDCEMNNKFIRKIQFKGWNKRPFKQIRNEVERRWRKEVKTERENVESSWNF